MPTERDQTRTIEQASRVLCRHLLQRGGIRSDIRDLAGNLLAMLEARDSKPVVTGPVVRRLAQKMELAAHSGAIMRADRRSP